MIKILIAVAVGAIVVFSIAAQPAQARHCSAVVATARGVTQGIAKTKAEWRRNRYVARNLSGWGLRAGPRNSCEGWGVGQSLRPTCKSGAVYCS